MSMPSTDERLSAYIDGDLSPDEIAALEHELAHDADLRADLDALRVVVDTFRSDGPVRAPLGFHAAVMDRIEAEHPEVPWWQQFLRRPFGIPAQGWGVVLAAAAVLVVVQVGRDDGEVAPEVDDPVWRDVPAAVEKAPAAAKLEEGGGEALRAAEPEAAPERPPKPSPEPVAEDVQSGKGPLDEKMALKAKELEAARAAEEAQQKKAGDTGKVPMIRTSPTGLTLLTREPAALREVLALVARYGGTVTTPDGGAVTHATLEQAEESVVVNIPSSQLAAFQASLESLGSVRAAFDKDKLYGGDTLQVPLTFKLVGGSAGTGDAEPLSPVKQRRAMEQDMLEAPDAAEERL